MFFGTRKQWQLVKQDPALMEVSSLWALGSVSKETHAIEVINQEMRLSAFMVDGCYGDEEEITLGYDVSNVTGVRTVL